MNSFARIISWNTYGEDICACAAKISTTKGNAIEIFDESKEQIKNRNLIKKVLGSGHKSVLEHTVFTIAFCNVSAVVEEFFIEHRLASFTVKSRRYVNYSELGYYIPPQLDGDSERIYREYMDALFGAYHVLVDMGIPKEDARFLLPYSFHSNFYCTLNGRELAHIIHEAQESEPPKIPEINSLLGQISSQLADICPSLFSELNWEDIEQNDAACPDEAGSDPTISFLEAPEIGGVELLQYPVHADEIIKGALKILHPEATEREESTETGKKACGRLLEQLVYTFQVSDITLSGLTHLVRHRMQSIIVPDIREMPLNQYVLPSSVCAHPEAKKLYIQTVEKAAALRSRAMQAQDLRQYGYYFALSGNLTTVMTSMNARELSEFIRLRSCNRAQWEIREVSIRLLKTLREISPEIFNRVGPGCYSEGYCPEGKMTCGKMLETVSSFTPN